MIKALYKLAIHIMVKECIAPQNIDDFQNSGGPGLQNIQPNNYYYLTKNPMDNEYVFFFLHTFVIWATCHSEWNCPYALGQRNES